MTTATLRPAPWGWLSLGLVAWVVAYASLFPFANTVISLLGLSRETHLGEAMHFFFYDTPKVLLLLTGIVFLMGVVRTFVSPERTRALLSGRRLGVGNVMAASLGEEQIAPVIEIARHIRDEAGRMLDHGFDEGAAIAAVAATTAVPSAPTLEVAPKAACCSPTVSGKACC